MLLLPLISSWQMCLDLPQHSFHDSVPGTQKPKPPLMLVIFQSCIHMPRATPLHNSRGPWLQRLYCEGYPLGLYNRTALLLHLHPNSSFLSSFFYWELNVISISKLIGHIWHVLLLFWHCFKSCPWYYFQNIAMNCVAVSLINHAVNKSQMDIQVYISFI